MRPAFAGDVAKLAVDMGQGTENSIIDAVGPDIMTFEEMVRLLAEKMGQRARLVHLRPGFAHAMSTLVGLTKRDVALTRDEIAGLMQERLVTDGPATCSTQLSVWLNENAGSLGLRYESELKRHYR